MRVLVPFDARAAKTRLDPPLSRSERQSFARAMLQDVTDALTALDYEPTVLSTAPLTLDVPVAVDERDLTPAINARLGTEPTAVVMADLALVTPAVLSRLFETEGGVVLAPGLGGGTNAMVVRNPDFAVDFHGASIRDHRRLAAEVDADVATVDSFRLGLDVDEPADFAEVLLHADGHAAAWLRRADFELAVDDGRVTVTRSGSSSGESG